MNVFRPFSLNIRGKLHTFDRPLVMGIVNVTPDSFYSGSQAFNTSAIELRVQQIIAEGADIIDIGGYSSRPGAAEVPETEEMRRLQAGIEIVRSFNKNIPVSIDTFRASVARKAI